MLLKELYEELDFPSKTKLAQAAKRRGISTEGIDDLYKDGVRQLFGKAPASKGAIAATSEDHKFQADIIDCKGYILTYLTDGLRDVFFTEDVAVVP